jgi:glycosyltransferase involved in cell wall biosynthesis
MTKAPTATVLMPAYNAERFIGEAIRSCLAQTHADFELLIVEDGSTDGTAGVIAGFCDPRIKVLANGDNRGPAFARNRGLAEARGEFIALLDSDDAAMPRRLEIQTRTLRADREAAMCAAWAEVVDRSGKRISRQRWRLNPEALHYQLHLRNCICHSSVMMRKEAVLKAGGYDPRFRHAEDFDLWGRMSREGRALMIGTTLVKRRIHPACVSLTSAEAVMATAAKIVAERMHRLVGLEPEAPVLEALRDKGSVASLDHAYLPSLAATLRTFWPKLVAASPPWLDREILRRYVLVEEAWYRLLLSRRGCEYGGSTLGSPGMAARAEAAIRAALGGRILWRLTPLMPKTRF